MSSGTRDARRCASRRARAALGRGGEQLAERDDAEQVLLGVEHVDVVDRLDALARGAAQVADRLVDASCRAAAARSAGSSGRRPRPRRRRAAPSPRGAVGSSSSASSALALPRAPLPGRRRPRRRARAGASSSWRSAGGQRREQLACSRASSARKKLLGLAGREQRGSPRRAPRRRARARRRADPRRGVRPPLCGCALAIGPPARRAERNVSTGRARAPTSAPAVPTEHQLLLFWLQLLALLLTARALGGMLRAIGQPAVIGELAAGLLLGPSVFGHLAPALHDWLFPDDPLQRALLAGPGVDRRLPAADPDRPRDRPRADPAARPRHRPRRDRQPRDARARRRRARARAARRASSAARPSAWCSRCSWAPRSASRRCP